MNLFLHALRVFARKYSWEGKWWATILFAAICVLFTAVSCVNMNRRLEQREEFCQKQMQANFNWCSER